MPATRAAVAPTDGVAPSRVRPGAGLDADAVAPIDRVAPSCLVRDTGVVAATVAPIDRVAPSRVRRDAGPDADARARSAAAALVVGALLASCLPSDYFLPGGDPGATEAAPPCENGALDPGESDVDCGPACDPCPLGRKCQGDGACQSGLCVDGLCHEDLCAPGLECPPPPDPCWTSRCDPSVGCVQEPAEPGTICDEPRVGAGLCKDGTCFPACGDCSALDNQCRVGVCLPQTGDCAVQWVQEGQKCFHGGCMIPGVCSRGVCVSDGAPAIFESDFSDPGFWSTTGLWEIGIAQSSMCGSKAEDPPDDHSGSGDERLAGLVIGGCIPPEPGPTSCLTSGPIDVPFPDPMIGLTLRWWEVTDLPPMPFALSSIELDRGKGWEVLEYNGGTPSPMWSERKIPIDPFGAPVLQVRFCVQPMGMMFEPVAGWSVDDVAVLVDGC
ncbi:MAG: hypothetical protein R3B09_08480 [Nannocystaceae bacterium]